MRTAYVQQCPEPWGKLPCAAGAYSTQEAGAYSSPYVQHGGSTEAPGQRPLDRGPWTEA